MTKTVFPGSIDDESHLELQIQLSNSIVKFNLFLTMAGSLP